MFRLWLLLIALLGVPAALLVAAPRAADRAGYSVPPVELIVNGKEVSSGGGVSVDGPALNVRATLPQPTTGISAVLRRDGIVIETIPDVSGSEISFGPVLMPVGESQIIVELRRRIWPIERSSPAQSANWSLDRSKRHIFDVWTRPGTQQTKPAISVPPVIWSHQLPVSVAATPHSQATFFLNGHIAEVRRVDPDGMVRVSPDGTFYVDTDGTLDVTLLLKQPGDYRIKVIIDDGGSAPGQESDTVLARFRPEPPQVSSRKLSITIAPNRFYWTMEATLDQFDPRLKALLDGSASIETFAHAIHGRIFFDNGYYREVGLRDFRLSPVAGNVRVSFRSRNFGFDPAANGQVTVRRDGGAAVPEANDIFEVAATGREFRGFVPAPQGITGNVAQWTADLIPDAGVVVRLSEVPRQISLWKLKPEQMIARRYVGWAYDVLALIPILWISYLLRQGFGDSLDPAQRRRLRSDLFLLGILVVFQSTYILLRDLFRASVPVLDVGAPTAVGTIRDFGGEPLFGLTLFFVAYVLARVAGVLVLRGAIAIVFSDLASILLCAAIASAILGTIEVLPLRVRLDELPASELLSPALCSIVVIALVQRLWRTVAMLSGRSPHIPSIFVAAVVVIVIAISWPYMAGEELQTGSTERIFDDAASNVFTLIGQLSSIAPIVAASLTVAALMNRGRMLAAPGVAGLRLMLFASVLVGTNPTWGIVPVPLLLAVALFAPVVLISPRRANLLNHYRGEILADRKQLLRLAYEHAQALAGSEGIFAWLKPKGSTDASTEKSAPLMVTMPDGTRMQAAEVAFAFGPKGQASRNARLALRIGLWGALAFAALYGAPAFVQPREYDPFPYLWGMIRVLSVGGYWLVGAFFFGYFYECIRGRAGWEKGAWLALGISLAEAPFAILNADSGADFAAAAITVAQRFAFFIFIGLLAFDQRMFKSALGHRVDWHMFPRVSGLSVAGAFGSALVASAGVAISSALTGQLTTVLALVAQSLLPVSPPTPPLNAPRPQQESARAASVGTLVAANESVERVPRSLSARDRSSVGSC